MGRVIRAVVAIGVLLLLAAGAPAMRASWQTLTHFQAIRNGSVTSLGTLTVTSCRREPLPRDWSCRGNYVVTDPLGDPGHDRLDIPLANDFRKHAVGDRIGVETISAREDAAYLFGTTYLVKIGAFWLGVLAALIALVLTFVRLWGMGIAALIAMVIGGLLMSPVLLSIW
ncbi:MAG: hypothetical protein JO079_15175 [Frankiaceae bacterium]|nr:hypothetical protein [Frankiaceae bacterium]MBV9368729.1 hypothetical protein [Frankiales bacterium]